MHHCIIVSLFHSVEYGCAFSQVNGSGGGGGSGGIYVELSLGIGDRVVRLLMCQHLILVYVIGALQRWYPTGIWLFIITVGLENPTFVCNL